MSVNTDPELIPLSDAEKIWSAVNVLPIAQLGNLTTLAGHMRFHGHLVIGRTLIRHAKVANKWRISEPDLRAAAVDLASLLTPGIERVTIGRNGRTWRGLLARALDHLEESPRFYAPDWGFLHLPEVCELQGKVWTLPAAYGPFLDDGYRLTVKAGRRARKCSECGREDAQSEIETASGYVKLCGNCHAKKHGELREYAGEFHGVRYSNGGRGGPNTGSARAYRCVVCAAQAVAWDHCHDHGYIRGPLCGACNRHDGVVRASSRPPLEHLWRCPTCRAGRSIPVVTRAKMIGRSGMLWAAALRDASQECHPEGFPLYNGVDQITVGEALEGRGPLVIAWHCATCGKPSTRRLSPAELATMDAWAVAVIRDGFAGELEQRAAGDPRASDGPDGCDAG